MVEIVNMDTGKNFTYINMRTEDALILAYHQSRGNNNTWEYATIQHPEIEVGNYFMFLEHFAGREYLKRNSDSGPLE